MSQSSARRRGSGASAGAKGRAAQAAARRRHRRWWQLGGAGAAVAAIAGVILGLHYTSQSANSVAVASAASGRVAPDGTFTDLAGHTIDVASLHGQATLLWFVSTWCSSCQAGTPVMAQNLAKLHADGVKVDEIELYADLGQSGPSMGQFAQTLAGAEFGNPDWTFGVSSAGLTRTYDPKSYLDIYYLIDAKGQVAYVNSSPGSTMPQLLAAAGSLA